MGTFSDLPKDVKWLIFRQIALDIIQAAGYTPKMFTEGHPHPTIFSLTAYITNQMMDLALVCKSCLSLIRSKCFKKSHACGWLFKRGALF